MKYEEAYAILKDNVKLIGTSNDKFPNTIERILILPSDDKEGQLGVIKFVIGNDFTIEKSLELIGARYRDVLDVYVYAKGDRYPIFIPLSEYNDQE
jgi:hypothetical protein